jgi:hypothetical protein
VLELTLREVQAHGPRPSGHQPPRALRGAAPDLQHRTTADVAQHLHVCLVDALG